MHYPTSVVHFLFRITGDGILSSKEFQATRQGGEKPAPEEKRVRHSSKWPGLEEALEFSTLAGGRAGQNAVDLFLVAF